MKEIYGLTYDYIERQGSILQLSKGEGIHSEELSWIQVKMLHVILSRI